MDTGKKISFGFNKLSKKPANLIKPQEKQVEFVVSLEGQSIKLKNEIQVVEKQPLVIPLRDNKKDLLDRVKDMKAKQKLKEVSEIEDNRPDSELTVDELAAREVIREAKLRLAEKDATNNKVFILPMKKEDELPLEGEKESTLSDYENVPVSDFGLAILRGMGWKEGVGIGKNPTKSASFKAPDLRPKGLGLGASAMAKSEKPVTDTNDQSLILKKGSYAKIVNGNRKGQYCEVQGLDDEAGRVIVKTSLKNEVLALNEFMLVAVTKEEYSKSSKVINNAKFEEYKEMEQTKIKTEVKNEREDNDHFDNYKSTLKNVKSERKDESSDESDSNTHSRKNKDHTGKSRDSKKYSDDSSLSDSDYERSRKTHRRKDKRRHRDKSRSPYKTKHKSSKKSSKSKHRHSSSHSDSEHEHKHKNRHGDERHRRRNKR